MTFKFQQKGSPALKAAIASVVLAAAGSPALVSAEERLQSIPSVIVTAENAAPIRGAVQTPIWIGVHDGTFDIYDRNVPLGAGSLVSRESVERLAEDGATGPISAEFAGLQPLAPQATLVSSGGPLTPSTSVSTTLNLDPETHRYFSYASMVIPSNDAFIANGNPLAHPLFDEDGRFIAEDFAVAGREVLDAGTEANDEVAANTAFLNQAGPNIGVEEDGTVVIHPGFRTDLSFPDGVLNHPIFGNADFTAPTYRAANFSFRFVDLGRFQRYEGEFSAAQEVSGAAVQSEGRGRAFAVTRGDQVAVRVAAFRLSGPATMIHLHNAPEGANGPVVANLTPDIVNGGVARSVFLSEDVLGPLAATDNPVLSLINEMAAGRIYVNVHTAANPAGEVRAQLSLQ